MISFSEIVREHIFEIITEELYVNCFYVVFISTWEVIHTGVIISIVVYESLQSVCSCCNSSKEMHRSIFFVIKVYFSFDVVSLISID